MREKVELLIRTLSTHRERVRIVVEDLQKDLKEIDQISQILNKECTPELFDENSEDDKNG